MKQHRYVAKPGGEEMGNKLIELRSQKGWTQKEVAKKIGISRQYYGFIETGQRQKRPNLFLAKKIAEIFETSVDEIFFGGDCYITQQEEDVI